MENVHVCSLVIYNEYMFMSIYAVLAVLHSKFLLFAITCQTFMNIEFINANVHKSGQFIPRYSFTICSEG